MVAIVEHQTIENIRDAEKVFHDEWASNIDVSKLDPAVYFESSVALEGRWITKELGSLDGLKVLELGSGAGEGAVYFATKGGVVTATDISPGMLEVASKLAAKYDVEIQTAVCSADDLSIFDDETFDLVYGANLLHHVVIEDAIKEVHRVLRPGGRAAFWDPVHYNPVINLYRSMATEVRTIDEHPLRIADIRLMKQTFGHTKFKFTWLTSLLVFCKFFVIDRIHPNADRYWKVIFDREKSLRGFMKVTSGLDSALIKIFPPLKWLCWNVSCILKK